MPAVSPHARRSKAEDQMEWIRRMNSIRNRAEELVLSELI
ncbi:MAG: TnpV protein [Clostridia bacterium]|nr:TnpV protein [Clostridia bacterium]